jgi:hypothetical protein
MKNLTKFRGCLAYTEFDSSKQAMFGINLYRLYKVSQDYWATAGLSKFILGRMCPKIVTFP